MSTTITVTAEHIDAGISGSCSHCPVALALLDAFPETDISANGDIADILPRTGGAIRLDLPAEVEDFIVRFDEDGFGEPFSFTVDYEGTEAA